MSEMEGQARLTDYLPEDAPAETEGYDASGNLINPAAGNVVNPDERLMALAVEINMLEHSARETFKVTAMEIGRRLVEAQGLIPRGRWTEWLKANIDYSERKANQLMQVYTAYGSRELPEAYDRLSFTQIYDLLSAPEASRDQLAEEAADGGLSTRQLKERIKQLEEEHQKDNVKIYDLIQQNETAQRAFETQKDAVEYEKKIAVAQRQRAEVAEGKADVSAKRAEDAIRRANETDKALSEARAKIAELETRAPETVEVVPEETARELEELKIKLREAEAKQDTDQNRAKLALNLQARLGIMDINEQYAKVMRAIEQLRALDGKQADARLEELRKAGRMISGEM